MEVVPAVVGRILRLERAQTVIIAFAVEVDAVASCMAEHAVENDAHPLGLRRIDELLKLFVRAEERIDLMIVSRIVVMVARRLENGIEVDDGNAQFLQIGKLRSQPLDVAAEEIVMHDLLGVDILVVARLVAPIRMNDGALLLAEHVALAAEPVGEDLVHDGVLRPVGRLCALVEHGDLKRRRRVVVNAAHAAQMLAVVAVVPRARACGNDEVVPEQTAAVGQIDVRGIKAVLDALRRFRGQLDEPFPCTFSPKAQDDFRHFVLRLDANAELHGG